MPNYIVVPLVILLILAWMILVYFRTTRKNTCANRHFSDYEKFCKNCGQKMQPYPIITCSRCGKKYIPGLFGVKYIYCSDCGNKL